MKLRLILLLVTFMKYNINAQQNTSKTITQLYNKDDSILDLPWIWMSFATVAIVVLTIIGRKFNHKEH